MMCERYRAIITTIESRSMDELRFIVDHLGIPDADIQQTDNKTLEVIAKCPHIIELFARREMGLLPKDIEFKLVKCQH